MTKQSIYSVGIYVRLSLEDERAGESLSIENQKKMLTEYVSKQHGWNIFDMTATQELRLKDQVYSDFLTAKMGKNQSYSRKRPVTF